MYGITNNFLYLSLILLYLYAKTVQLKHKFCIITVYKFVAHFYSKNEVKDAKIGYYLSGRSKNEVTDAEIGYYLSGRLLRFYLII